MINRYKELLYLYKDEILRLMAVCKDFKISYEKVFKDKELLKYVYELDEKSKQYEDVYYMQKAYNEIYKKYSCTYDFVNIGFKKILYCIKDIYKQLENIFNCDIINLIAQYKKGVKQ